MSADLRPRAYLDAVKGLLIDPSIRRAVVLMGPRRVGKTILIRHLIGSLLKDGVPPRSIAYVEVDHPLLHGQSLESLVRLIERASDAPAAPRYVFFDEIQYLKDWERHLKALVDGRPDLRILVSGSAAAALKRRSQESGAGRFTDFLLPPLTFAEFLDLRNEPPAMREVGAGRYELLDIARLHYAKFGNDNEVDMIELDGALRPVSAIEIKWSNRHLDRPCELAALTRFCEANGLADAWVTTIDRFEREQRGATSIHCWPAAAFAFHLGLRAVKGRLATIELEMRDPRATAGTIGERQP